MICKNCNEYNAYWEVKFEKLGIIRLCDLCYSIVNGTKARQQMKEVGE